MSLGRLIIHVEGETEETFVRESIAPHLQAIGFASVRAKKIGNARARDRRGGIRSWPEAASDILQRLREDVGLHATTLVDYYALPSGGPAGWPGRDTASKLPVAERAAAVEARMEAEINAAFAETSQPRRFTGGVLLHEFEALLFSDCEAFAQGIGRPEVAEPMNRIRAGFSSPEHIDDSPQTAPSKRIGAIIPGYQKPIMGNVGALHIGLDAIRAHCPHFARWLLKLESLVRPQA